MNDELRPRGTVTVPCSHPNCQPEPGSDLSPWCFWVDALDPRLPDGPFLCPDHDGVDRGARDSQPEAKVSP
jgi:hypothetical protein